MTINFSPPAAAGRVTHRAEWQEQIPGITKPVHVPSLLESMGCCPHDTSDEHGALVQSYIDGDLKWEALMASTPVRFCRKCRGAR